MMAVSASSSIVDYGYDVSFVDDVWDELKCTVCHLVLRNPVQIMSCGHRYCNPCFDRMKNHAQQSNIDLVCPVDREIVPLNQVFPDRAIGRTVGNLKVKCGNVERGCTWIDDSRDLHNHEEKCEFRVIAQDIERLSIQQPDDGLMTMEQVLNRLDKLESDSLTKDKDIASLKLTVGELKLTVDTMQIESRLKDADINLLKTSNQQLLKRVEESTKRIDKTEEGKESMKTMITPPLVEKIVTEKILDVKANISSISKSLKNGKLDCYLCLNRPENCVGPLTLFEHEFTLTIQKNIGAVELHRFTHEMIQEDDFRIPNGKTFDIMGITTESPGHDFVINDSLFVTCTIHI